MPSRDVYSKITVEVVAVKRMCKPEDVVLVACKPGDVLRVTEDISTAAGVSAAYS
jgi:pyrroline-5-carboxylate reductase